MKSGLPLSAGWTPAFLANRRAALLLFGALLGLQALLFLGTYQSLVATWWRSETFAHGFVILPISAYLIWKKRQLLAACRLETDGRALPVLALLAFGWLLGDLADVLVVQQFFLVAMLPALVWLLFGPQLCKTLAFPLAFLVFMVPMGESLVYPLMQFTAAFTVNAVRLMGIPVFWEGMYFTLPSGSWSVVEACSGFRYVMASLTLGSLYAYLTYRSFKRRFLFILASAIVPIFANGLRALMIVMLGHWSDMKLATGVDHLIYGWIWFGVVMFIMFWVGGRWREDMADEGANLSAGSHAVEQVVPAPVRIHWFTAALAALTLVAAVFWAGLERASGEPLVLDRFQAAGSWQQNLAFSAWQPAFLSPSHQLERAYRRGESLVGMQLLHYASQSQGQELASGMNRVVAAGQHEWQRLDSRKHGVETAAINLSVEETRVRSANQNLLVWHWYEVGGVHTASPYLVKIMETWRQLFGEGREGTVLFIYAPYEEDIETARVALRGFLQDNFGKIEAVLQPPSHSESPARSALPGAQSAP